MKPTLILLVGVPGSGKTTWAYRNAGEGTVVVSQDDLIDAITPSGFDYSARPIYAAAEEAIARAAILEGRNVIVDRTNRTRTLRQRWIEMGRQLDCAVVAVVMPAAFETCRQRNRARLDHRRVCDGRMERMIGVFEPPQVEEGFHAIFEDAEQVTLNNVVMSR